MILDRAVLDNRVRRKHRASGDDPSIISHEEMIMK